MKGWPLKFLVLKLYLSYLVLISLAEHEWCDTGSCPKRSMICMTAIMGLKPR